MGKLKNIIKEAENRINIAMANNKTEYQKMVNKAIKDRNERAKYLFDYDLYNSKIQEDRIKSPELKDYVYNLVDLTSGGLKNNKEYKIFLPMYKLCGWYHYEDIVYMVMKVLHSHEYLVTDENKVKKVQEIKKDEYMLVSCDQFSVDSSSQLIIYDVDNKEVITKHTEFKFETVEKTIEKTKIVKQEVKSGIDPNKLEKAKKKILHKWKDEKWAKNEEVLSDFISEITK